MVGRSFLQIPQPFAHSIELGNHLIVFRTERFEGIIRDPQCFRNKLAEGALELDKGIHRSLLAGPVAEIALPAFLHSGCAPLESARLAPQEGAYNAAWNGSFP